MILHRPLNWRTVRLSMESLALNNIVYLAQQFMSATKTVFGSLGAIINKAFSHMNHMIILFERVNIQERVILHGGVAYCPDGSMVITK